MRSMIIETHVLPPISICALMQQLTQVYIERFENYQKRSYRNRFTILSAQGPSNISIPLTKGKHQQKIITQVEISYNDDWITKLQRQIKTNYGSAPYFDFYFDSLSAILDKRHQFLFDLNNELLLWAIKHAQLSISIDFTRQYQVSVYPSLDMRNSNQKILSNTQHFPEYGQVFQDEHGFTRDLSILDALFCLGPSTAQMIKSVSFNELSLPH